MLQATDGHSSILMRMQNTMEDKTYIFNTCLATVNLQILVSTRVAAFKLSEIMLCILFLMCQI